MPAGLWMPTARMYCCYEQLQGRSWVNAQRQGRASDQQPCQSMLPCSAKHCNNLALQKPPRSASQHILSKWTIVLVMTLVNLLLYGPCVVHQIDLNAIMIKSAAERITEIARSIFGMSRLKLQRAQFCGFWLPADKTLQP